MTPEKAEQILRGTVMSLTLWIEEADLINEAHPGAAAHLAASLRQARQSLQQMLERD
jgi:hypothetical protein